MELGELLKPMCVSVCKESVIEGHTEEEAPRGARKAFVTSEL